MNSEVCASSVGVCESLLHIKLCRMARCALRLVFVFRSSQQAAASAFLLTWVIKQQLNGASGDFFVELSAGRLLEKADKRWCYRAEEEELPGRARSRSQPEPGFLFSLALQLRLFVHLTL